MIWLGWIKMDDMVGWINFDLRWEYTGYLQLCNGWQVCLTSQFIIVVIALVLWHINHCWLFNAKSSLYIYIKDIYDL